MPGTAYTLQQRVAGAAASGIILTIIGAIAIWARQPILAPSLASALFVQTLTPHENSARLWPTIVGQAAGVAGGFVAVYLVHAAKTPSFIDHHALLPTRLAATLIAVVLTSVLQLLFNAVSPAGAATALVVSLGVETADWPGAARLLFAILLAAALGEAARVAILKMR